MKGRRPTECHLCAGRVRMKDERWWCYECDQPVPSLKARLPRLGRGPEERRARVRERNYGSAERIAWLHQLPCVAQGLHQCWPWDMDRGGPHIQAVHVRARGAGGGADDQVPGCQGVQQDAGEMGTGQRALFEAETGLDLVQRAAELAEDWRELEQALAAGPTEVWQEGAAAWNAAVIRGRRR